MLLIAVLALLLVAAWVAYGQASAREAADRRLASMDAAMADMNGHCWVCTGPARVLELVDAGYSYALACSQCAETLKGLTRSDRKVA